MLHQPVFTLALYPVYSNFFFLLLGGQFLRNARAVAFNPEPSESLDVLTRVLQVLTKLEFIVCNQRRNWDNCVSLFVNQELSFSDFR